MYFHGYIGDLILKFIKSNVILIIILWISLFYEIHVLFMLNNIYIYIYIYIYI